MDILNCAPVSVSGHFIPVKPTDAIQILSAKDGGFACVDVGSPDEFTLAIFPKYEIAEQYAASCLEAFRNESSLFPMD